MSRPNTISSVLTWGAGAILAIGLTACGGDESPGEQCQATLLAGDLVITEIMANPAGQDQGNEWFEIYNTTSQAIPLNGLVLSASKTDGSAQKFHVIESDETLEISPGEYFVVGGVLPEFQPIYVSYGYSNDLGTMGNTSGKLVLGCDGVAIDEVEYEEIGDGVSMALSGTPDYQANDDWSNWCEQSWEFIADNLGTPGGPNDLCGNSTECLDGDTPRAINLAGPGDIIITEFMANPGIASDANGEWFEIYVVNSVDLNGLRAGKTPSSPKVSISEPDCVPATAGSYYLFAVNAETTENGGLPVVDFTLSGSFMTNSPGENPGTLFIGTTEGVVDDTSWTSSQSNGVSKALHTDYYDAADNDDELFWCASDGSFGDGDMGTPKAANGTCDIAAPAGMCYDGGVLRAIDYPTAGQIVINEYHANPLTDEANREWLELAASATFDLNELELGRAEPPVGAPVPGNVSQVLSSGNCATVNSGDYILFARNTDTLMNGGLPTADFQLDFGLVNSTDGLFISLGDGATILDVLAYDSTPSGRSVQRDPGAPTTFCNAPDGETYGSDGERGTPGDVNSCI